MAVVLSPVGGVAAQFFTNDGIPLSGGKIYTYVAGTSTPQTTYTSSIGNIQHSNPIVLDSAGRVPSGEIWLTDSATYKFVIKDQNDVLIGTYDNVIGINSNFVNYTSQQEIQTATEGQTVFNLTTMEYQPTTGNLSVFVDGINQYGPGAQYAFLETDSNTVTFVSGLHEGALVKFTSTQIENASGGDASQITYTYPAAGAVQESVEARLAQYVSVKDFGAIGDGVEDDTAAIQAAFNSILTTKQCLVFPAGTYKLTTNITYDLSNDVFVLFDGDVNFINQQYLPDVDTNPTNKITCSTIRKKVSTQNVGSIEGTSLNAIVARTSADNTNFPTAFTNVVGQYIVAEGVPEAIKPRFWALNTVTNVHSNHSVGAEAYGLEVDVNIDSDIPPQSGTVSAVYIAGIGDMTNVTGICSAIWVRRLGDGTYQWPTGLLFEECQNAIVVNGNSAGGSKVDRAMLLYGTDADIKIVPKTATGSKYPISIWKTDDSIPLGGITDKGGILCGGGTVATKIISNYAPNVGSGIIPAQSSISIPYTTIFGAVNFDLTKSTASVTASAAGGLPNGVFVDYYVNTTTSTAYIRWTNSTSSNVGNSPYDLRIAIMQF